MGDPHYIHALSSMTTPVRPGYLWQPFAGNSLYCADVHHAQGRYGNVSKRIAANDPIRSSYTRISLTIRAYPRVDDQMFEQTNRET